MSDMCYHCTQPGVTGSRCKLCGSRRITSSSSKDQDILPPGTLLDDGNIVIGELLGRGGFGATYIARDSNFGVIALKEFFPKHLSMRIGRDVIPIDASRDTYEKCKRDFQREARLINSLDEHPNVVRVFFSITENNTCYYGMELLHGCSLSAYLRSRKLLSLVEAVQLLEPVMNALSFMHARQMLHRDISPDNIYLRETPSGFSPCLIDFGAAYSARRDFTQSMPRVRNLHFSPPDQNYPREQQGPPMDIYALSATLYFMVSGKPPVSADDRIIDGLQLIPVTTHVAHLPDELWQVINRGMALERAKRFQSIAELRTALYALLPPAEPIASAERPSPKPSVAPAKPEAPVVPTPPAAPTPPVPAPRFTPPVDHAAPATPAAPAPGMAPPQPEEPRKIPMQLLSCLLEWLLFYSVAFLCFRGSWIPALLTGLAINTLINLVTLCLPGTATMGQRILNLDIPVNEPSVGLCCLYSLSRAAIPFALVDEILILAGVYRIPLVWQLHKDQQSPDPIIDCLIPINQDRAPTGVAVILPLGPDRDFQLGRGIDPVPIQAGRVSREHCSLRLTSTGVVLINHQPTNSTWINDVKLQPNSTHPLTPGDAICLAGQVRFLYDRRRLSSMQL